MTVPQARKALLTMVANDCSIEEIAEGVKSVLTAKEKRESKKTLPSKYRKGFPVKLNHGWAFGIQVGYAYLKSRGKTTPTMDEIIKLIPDPTPTKKTASRGTYSWDYIDNGRPVTLRVRGDQIGDVCELFEALSSLGSVTLPWALKRRAEDLRKIAVADAIMDVGR